MGFRGIDIREPGDRVIFDAELYDSDGAIVTSGTTNLKLYELQSDGTVKSYDWNDNTFKTGALTTENQVMTHRQGNNSTTNIGLWTYALTTVAGFTAGNTYYAAIDNSNAVPEKQVVKWQYGSGILADVVAVSGDSAAADNLEATYDGTGYSNVYAPAQQQQVQNIAIGSSAISTTATAAVITAGSQTGTYANTQARDGVLHQIADAAGTTDLYYAFGVGGTGVPTSVTLYGRSTGLNDPMKVYGYDWVAAGWVQIGTVPGSPDTSTERTFSLLSTMVGSGANSGVVRIRFYNTGLTSASLKIDQLFVSYSVVSSAVGYAGGMIWVDTVNGTAGTAVGVNGVADNPVDSWADALSLAASTGLSSFNIGNGSSITLSGNSDNYSLSGEGWTLNLGGQSIDGLYAHGATVTGVGTNGATCPTFEHCRIGAATLPCCYVRTSALQSTLTCGEAGTYYLDRCYSGVAGTTAPIIDFGAAVGNVNMNVRNYSGGVDIRNMGATGTDRMSLEGRGQLIIGSNCDPSNSPVIAIRGLFTVTDNVAGGFVTGGGTLSDDARFDVTNVDTELTANHGAGLWTQAGAAGSNTVTLTIEEGDTTPIPEVLIDILSTGGALLDSKLADANGQAVFSLDDDTYNVRLRKARTSFTVPETLVVSGDTATTYNGTVITPSVPIPGGQTLYAYLYTLAGGGGEGDILRARIYQIPQDVSGAVIDSQVLSDTADVNGYAELTLTQGAVARITAETAAGDVFFDRRITVTTDATKDLTTY